LTIVKSVSPIVKRMKKKNPPGLNTSPVIFNKLFTRKKICIVSGQVQASLTFPPPGDEKVNVQLSLFHEITRDRRKTWLGKVTGFNITFGYSQRKVSMMHSK
jgi:hypothetical protein